MGLPVCLADIGAALPTRLDSSLRSVRFIDKITISFSRSGIILPIHDLVTHYELPPPAGAAAPDPARGAPGPSHGQPEYRDRITADSPHAVTVMELITRLSKLQLEFCRPRCSESNLNPAGLVRVTSPSPRHRDRLGFSHRSRGNGPGAQ